MYGSLGLLWTPVSGCLTPFTSKDSATASNHKQYLSTQKTIGAFSGSRILLGHRKLLSSSKISTYWRAGLSSTTSAILTDDNSTMTTSEDDTENIGLLGTDPGLEPFIDHFRYRVKRYVDQKKLIEKYEGSLEEFALGAKIQITRDADADPYSATRPVELIGTSENINMAEKLIKDVIAEADAGGSPSLVARGFGMVQAAGTVEQVLIQVPNEKVGVIIGKGGETIKNLQTRSGARIQALLFGTFMEDETRSWLKQSYEKTENHVEKNEKHVEKKELEVGSSNVGTGLSFG